jgi:hypothetical protein
VESPHRERYGFPLPAHSAGFGLSSVIAERGRSAFSSLHLLLAPAVKSCRHRVKKNALTKKRKMPDGKIMIDRIIIIPSGIFPLRE